MFQFLIGPSRGGRTVTRTSTRRLPRPTPGLVVLPMRTSEISRLSTDTSPTLVPLAEMMMSPGSRPVETRSSQCPARYCLRNAKSLGVTSVTAAACPKEHPAPLH
jgi:hypothetical protein